MAIDYGSVIDVAARTDNINTSGLPIDMEADTALYNPDAYPFEALIRTIGGKVETAQMKHEFRERRLIPNWVTCSSAADVGDTTLTINDYAYIKTDNYLYNPKYGEMLLVSTTPTTSTVTVCRVTGSGGIENAIGQGDPLIIVGESHAEGEEVPATFSNDSINKYNYVMQSDRRISVTDIEEAVMHYDSTELRDMNRRLAMIEYRRNMDLLFYVGVSTREVTSASGPRRHCCSGLIELLTENGVDLAPAGGTLTIATLGGVMANTTLNNNSTRKLGIAGVNAQQQISAWAKDALRETSGADKRWGIRLNSIITGFGDMDLMFDPVLNASYGLDDRMFVLDMPHVKELYLRTKPVQFYLNVPNLSTLHTTVDAISGTFGLQVKFPELHAAIKGIK